MQSAISLYSIIAYQDPAVRSLVTSDDVFPTLLTGLLVVADGAVILDTTGMGIDEVIRRITGMAEEVRS